MLRDVDFFHVSCHETPCINIKSTFLILHSSAKVEEVFDKPRVLIIHDIINESEIEEVLSLASGRLRRATARNARTGQFEPADYRIR